MAHDGAAEQVELQAGGQPIACLPLAHQGLNLVEERAIALLEELGGKLENDERRLAVVADQKRARARIVRRANGGDDRRGRSVMFPAGGLGELIGESPFLPGEIASGCAR